VAAAIEIQSVTKIFKLYREKAQSAKERVIRAGRNPYTPFYALRDINLEVAEGETLAMLGHNGSGKSTLLKCVAGTLRPTTGRIATRGRLAALLELGAGFHPDLTGRENVFLNGSILGFSKQQVERIFDDVVDFSELSEFIDMQVKHYSSGMYARLGFAVAINVEPDVLLVDEVLSVGDEAFQRKCLDRVRTFQREGRTILLVSHATDTVRQIAHRAAVFDHGQLLEVGDVGDAIRTFWESLNRAHEIHGEAAPPQTAVDPVTGELPVVVAPVELVADPAAEVSITSVDIEYPNPAYETLAPGRPLNIRVAYHATGMITDVVFAIEIFDDDGKRLLGTTTDVLDQPIHAVSGDGQVIFRFEQVPLLDGTFHLTFTIHTRDGGTIYHQRDYLDSFQVTNRSRTRGLVLFPIKVEHLYNF
jgi:ABC-2 type transport system ATP-binding protein